LVSALVSETDESDDDDDGDEAVVGSVDGGTE
jgi:hypothetical protein